MLLRLALPIVLAASVLIAAPSSVGAGYTAHAEEVPTDEVAQAPTEPAAPADDTPAPAVIEEPAPAEAAQVELTGTVEIVEADGTLNADGTMTTPAVHEVAFVLTDSGERVELAGELPEGTESGATFTGTVAVEEVEKLDVDAEVLAEASTKPLEGAEAEQVLASATTEQVAVSVVSATVTAPEAAEVATPGAHSLYIAIVRPKGSSISTSTISGTYLSKLVKRVSNYWAAQSGGAITRISTASVIRTTSAYSCANGISSVSGMWNEAAAKFTSNPNSFFGGDSRRHLVVLTPDGSTASGPCASKLGFSGLGTIGSSSASGGKIHSTVGSALSAATLAHEFGHNLSLGHANVALCANATVVEAPASGCVINEYYDLYDVMGATVVGQSGLPSLSLPAKERLGFIADSDVVTAALDGASDSSFTEVIRPISTTTGIRGFSITDPTNGDNYWVELRTTSGQDVNLLANRDTFAMCVNTCPSWKFAFGDGVRILKHDADANPRETLVVAAPATVKRGIQTRELALDTLDSFSTRSGGVHVDVNWATSKAASVTVRLTSSPTLVPSLKGHTVRGYATVGESLIASEQHFRQPSATVSYQWLRGGSPISGATGASYSPTLDDLGQQISLRTTGSLFGTSASTTSAPLTIGLVRQRAAAQQPLTIVKPDPEHIAGSGLTPSVMLYNDEPGVTGTPKLFWIDPIERAFTTRAFDEDGVSSTPVPWYVGSVTQSVSGSFLDRTADETVELTPSQATPSVRLTLSTSTTNRSTKVKAYTSFVSMAWHNHPPTGTMEIYSDGVLVASKQLTLGKATIYIPVYATTGRKNITAVYVGDQNFTGDSSVVRALYVR